MPGLSYLDLVRQGVDVWNEWRRSSSSKEAPNLWGADLRGANLRGFYLRDAILKEAKLAGADLSGASLGHAFVDRVDLASANLSDAYLVGTHIRHSDLRGANLSRAQAASAEFDGSNLCGADLSDADLSDADFTYANLSGADLSRAQLFGADLSSANLRGAVLIDAWLTLVRGIRVDLSQANLEGARLQAANLSAANLTGANLRGTDLSKAILVDGKLVGADLTGSRIFDVSAWKVNAAGAIQSGLVVTEPDEPLVTVDDLEVAQFVYLLLHNEKIRSVIDTITSKVVLILGRFTLDRKAVLERLRTELRYRGYLPVIFDFESPTNRNLTETVSTLAHLARFVIADITDPRSIPQELQRIIPQLPSLPVQPIIESSQQPWGMFGDLQDYHWVLQPFGYGSAEHLLTALSEHVIAPAEQKAIEILRMRAAADER